MAAMEAFGRAVRELHAIDPKKTARVLDRVSLPKIVNRLQSVSLLQISHTLAELNQADPDRARALYYKIPSELLAKKLASEQLDFQKLGSLTCNLTKVDGSDRKTSAMLREAGTDFLIRRIHAERFEGIAAGLYDVFKCDAALGREVLSQLPDVNQVGPIDQLCKPISFDGFNKPAGSSRTDLVNLGHAVAKER